MSKYFLNTLSIVEQQIPKKIISWLTILWLSFIIFLLISIYYKYPQMKTFSSQVIQIEDKYYLKTNVETEDINYLIKGKLVIGDNKLEHNIISIQTFYYLEQEYYEIILKCKLPKQIQYENLPVQLRFQLNNTTIKKEIIKKIKKGMI